MSKKENLKKVLKNGKKKSGLEHNDVIFQTSKYNFVTITFYIFIKKLFSDFFYYHINGSKW
jgi:hypothetical protein